MALRAIAAAALAVATMISTTRPAPAPEPARAAASSAASCRADAKKANLSFTLNDVDGRPVRLADYRGKVLLLDFWATWCGPCTVEIPAFVDLYKKYKPRGFEIAGVVVMDRFANAKPFARAHGMSYTILDGVDNESLESAYAPLFGLPTSFLIARDGRICQKHVGLPRTRGGVTTQAVREAFEAEIVPLLN